MSKLAELSKKNYLEKHAFLPQLVQGARQLGAKGLKKGTGFLKSMLVPSIPELRQFESYMHSPAKDWMKRDIGKFTHPETGDTHYLHGMLAHNFGARYGAGTKHELIQDATRARDDLMRQVNSGKRDLTGKVYDFFAGPLDSKRVAHKFQRETDFADRMGRSTSAWDSLKNVKGDTLGETLGHARRYAGENIWPALGYGMPALGAYEVLKNRDPSQSLPEQMGDVLGSTIGGAATFPLGLVGGTIGATTGGSMGKFVGKQVGKLTGAKPGAPVGYNPPQTMMNQSGYNNPYNPYNPVNR